MTRIYLLGVYYEVQKNVLRNVSVDVLLCGGKKTATMLKSTALEAYLIHVVLLNCSGVH